MRNVRGAGVWVALTLIAGAIAAGTGGGCVPPDGAAAAGPDENAPPAPLKPKELRESLDAAYAAFGRKQYGEAMAGADRVLAGNPQSPGAAEAQYLRGRVFEARAGEASAAGNAAAAAEVALRSARDAYNAALALGPAAPLEGNVRAGVANVAYFQEDYPTAIAQWSAAYEKLTDPHTKAWVLYRVGLSQQRSGHFPAADDTFAAVRQQFPDTDPARRAAARRGARGFHVQVGTYAAPAAADATLAALRSQGVIGLSLPDDAGRHVVRVGPVRTFGQAKAMKARLVERYPGALIIP